MTARAPGNASSVTVINAHPRGQAFVLLRTSTVLLLISAARFWGARRRSIPPEPTAPPSSGADDLAAAPFGLTRFHEVVLPDDFRDAFPGTEVEDAARQGMAILEVLLNQSAVWEDRERTVEDYAPVRKHLTPLLWSRLAASVSEGAEVGSIAQVVVPGWQAVETGLVTAAGTAFTPNAAPPTAITAKQPDVGLVTDVGFFGDPAPRLGLRTSCWLTLVGTARGEPAETTYRLDLGLYLLPGGAGAWLLDAEHSEAGMEPLGPPVGTP